MAGKRGNGEGSIRQIKEKLWEGRYTAGTNPSNGKQIQKSVYGKTRAEVVIKLRDATKSVAEGTFVEPSKMKLAAWLDIWLKDFTGNVKEHTAVTYETQVRHHIKPALGAVPLSALRAHQIQAFYNQLSKGDDDAPGLSPKTIKNVHGVLHRALDQAVVLGYLKSNPCLGVKLPRLVPVSIKPLMDDQVDAFLKACKGNEYETLFTVDMFTGMRQSEIMGLTWDCVDFKNGTIYIDRQLIHEKKKGGVYKFAPPKNDKPRRITPPSTVMRMLMERKRQQNTDKIRAGEAWDNPMNLVFTNALGGHFVHNTLSHNFKRIVDSIGLPDRRFHDLRHTYAVLSIQSGVDIKTVQESLGHHTAAFTLDVYGHVTERMKNEAAARMEALIQRVKPGV